MGEIAENYSGHSEDDAIDTGKKKAKQKRQITDVDHDYTIEIRNSISDIDGHGLVKYMHGQY